MSRSTLHETRWMYAWTALRTTCGTEILPCTRTHPNLYDCAPDPCMVRGLSAPPAPSEGRHSQSQVHCMRIDSGSPLFNAYPVPCPQETMIPTTSYSSAHRTVGHRGGVPDTPIVRRCATSKLCAETILWSWKGNATNTIQNFNQRNFPASRRRMGPQEVSRPSSPSPVRVLCRRQRLRSVARPPHIPHHDFEIPPLTRHSRLPRSTTRTRGAGSHRSTN